MASWMFSPEGKISASDLTKVTVTMNGMSIKPALISMAYGEASKKETWHLPDGNVLKNVHPESVCTGEHCVIHAPSEHEMRDWPLKHIPQSPKDEPMFARVCIHNNYHYDPDEAEFFELVCNDCDCECCSGLYEY